MSKKHWGNIRAREAEEEYKRGWTPRGYDNMGPFNEVRIGPAGRNAADVTARGHDIEYGNEEAIGVTPHRQWVDADETFLEELQPSNWQESAAQTIFSLKKAGKNAGVIRDMSSKGKRKAIRASPWEEGEDYRRARMERNKRRNAALQGNIYEPQGETGNEIGLRVAMAAHDQEVEEAKQSEGTSNLPDSFWDQFEPNAAGQGWQEHITNLNGEGAMPIGVVGTGGHRTPGLRGSLSNLPPPTPMDTSDAGPDIEPEASALRATSGGPGNQVSKETPITNYPSLTYGLQETHTTILPWTGWISAARMDTGAPLQLRIRMNAPYDMLDVATNNAGVAVTKGFYSQPVKEDGNLATGTTTTAVNGISFPELIPNNATTTTERPSWRAYWAALYQYYTVLGCEYKVTIVNPVSNIGASVIVGTQFDSYTTASTSTGNIMPQANLSECMSYKNVHWDIINYSRSEVANKNTAVIAGTYRPGQIRRNIKNDGDVKTWTETGTVNQIGLSNDDGQSPTLKDFLTINLWKAPLGWHATNGVNMQIELKYIVQYKDLREQARYPNTLNASQDIVQTLNETRLALGTAHSYWG